MVIEVLPGSPADQVGVEPADVIREVNQRPVTNDRQINSKPEWSPDGTLIFFHRFEGDRWRLFTVHPDGSGLTEVAKGAPGNSEFPSR